MGYILAYFGCVDLGLDSTDENPVKIRENQRVFVFIDMFNAWTPPLIVTWIRLEQVLQHISNSGKNNSSDNGDTNINNGKGFPILGETEAQRLKNSKWY